MQNQEVIGLLMFHVVLSCPLSHFASESDKYRAMAVYANINCDDLSAKKKEGFHRFLSGIFMPWYTEFSLFTNSCKNLIAW